IRHGESTNNALPDATNRVADPLLTPAGERQALRVAEHLAALAHLHPTQRNGAAALDRLYCSAMLRAMQTADAIADRLGLAPELWLDIHEIGGIYLDHGERKVGYPGSTRAELERRFPNCVMAPDVRTDGWWNRPFEDHADGVDRAARVANILRDRANEATRIGLVTHGDFMSELVKALLDGPGGTTFYEHRNTAITCLELTPGLVRVRYVNRVEHLDDEAR
ncbi:MAG TPA: histidine phosphatase family protein, partial [Pseudomonadales bacterium]|nr:histidine phosphatase family protein [Pseudomonadales bacterium]